jgi:hypothetical protein
MRIKVIILLSTLLVLLSGCTGKKKNDWDNLFLKGKVKQIIELQYLAVEKFGKIEKGDLYRQSDWDKIIIFDEKGYYSEITYLSSYGETVGRTDYTYTPNGNLLVEQNYDAEGGFSDKKQYFYDDKGRVNDILMFNNAGGSRGSKIIRYDDKNSEVTISTYNFSGMLTYKEVQKLDGNGFPTETKIYNGDDVLVNHRIDKFDKNGLRKQMTAFLPDGSVYVKLSFTYDKNHNLLLQEGVDGNNEAFLPERYEYAFDNSGNWTKRIHYTGDTPKFVLERQIEYFE